MSLAKRLIERRELKTLVLDIERLPGLARVWGPKTKYIHPNNFVRWPSTLCFAAQWFGSKDMMFFAAWDDAQAMRQASWDLYNEADIVITYNGVGFDNKHLRSEWTEHRLGEPTPWRDVDLLKVVRATQGWEAKSLDQVCKRLGIAAKNDFYDADVAEAAMAGDIKAQKKLQRYNANDVKITSDVYVELMPYIKGHPHVAPTLGLERTTCPRCASSNVERNGIETPQVVNFYRYRCRDCGGNFRTTQHSRGPSVRAL